MLQKRSLTHGVCYSLHSGKCSRSSEAKKRRNKIIKEKLRESNHVCKWKVSNDTSKSKSFVEADFT